MKRSTTNRFLNHTFRTLSCLGAFTVCSAWANVMTLQPTSNNVVATKDLPSSTYTNSARGIDAAADTSSQLSFKSASESVAATEVSAAPAATLDSALVAQSASQPQVSASSVAPEQSFSVASTSTLAEPAGGAIAAAFDEEFVSVPTVQFATVTTAPSVSAPSAASVTAVPEMSAFFPIVGLIAAVSCTQILRRRRLAQRTAPIA